MKKEKLFCAFVAFFLIFSCKVGFEGEGNGKKTQQRSINYKKEAPDHLDLPLLYGGSKRFDVVKGYYIVRTSKDFDKSKFIKLGARICGTMKADAGNIFWHLYKNDNFFIKKVLKIEGVISAEYDFTVYHVRPPKDPLENLKPKPEDGHNGIGDSGRLRPMGLEDGKMDRDPRMKDVNYSLQITHALEAYKEFKDDHFKKPVLLGIIDTGFNYCNEDFWFKNKNGKDESVSYFTKSAFLVNVASRDFEYNLAGHVDENDPAIPYAKEFLNHYRNTNRFFEMPCSKVAPGSGMGGHSSPDSVMFWNWDNGAHGTHCSGMMAAVGDNDKGVVGVSWKNTKIASYKCFGGPTGGGWEIYGALDDYASYIEAGLAGKLDSYYKYDFETLQKRDGTNTSQAEFPYTSEQEKFNHYKDQGVYPVNMSLGGPFPTQLAAVVMGRCLKTGILPVVAMGNDGQRLIEFPTSYDATLSVGATDGRDRKKGFSCSGEWIDICAPGDGILSTGISPGDDYPWAVHWLPEETGKKPWEQGEIGKAYQTMSGTSMATPFMTGVLGYLLSFETARGKDPGWLKAIVQSTADPLEGQAEGQHHEDYGYGRVNVLKAAKAVKENKGFAGDSKFDYNTKRYVTIKIRNKRSKAPDLDGNVPKDIDLGLSGHSVVVYTDDSGDPKGFTMTNNKGEAEFFFLPKREAGKGYVARVNIDGEYYEGRFELKDTKEENVVTIEYDSPTIYISTITPHKDIFEKYSPDGEYDTDVDTIISIYEDGKFDAPIDRFDYYTLDTMAFNAKPGKTYFAEVTCFADPSTGNYRTGIYGLRIGYESLASFRKGNNDFLKPTDYEHDAKIKQPVTGRPIYELIHGMDSWEPNDDFEAARDKGDFIDFAKKTELKSYVVCCLTHQSDGLDRDIFMFKVPEWDED